MTLLLDGTDSVTVYPEVAADDGYGTTVRVAGTVAVVVPCDRPQPFVSSEPATVGQQTSTLYRFRARTVPGGAWSRVEWGGRVWDVVGEPDVHPGVSPLAAHVTVTMEARTPKALS